MMPHATQLADVSAALGATLSPDASVRRQAEEGLTRLRSLPGFPVALLHLVESADAAEPHVRQAAAVYLKNHTSGFYNDANWQAAASSADRKAVKDTIVAVMLRVPVLVRRQLSEVLAIIAEHEYPEEWPDLVPQLGKKLKDVATVQPIDWTSMQGVLETLHAVFERYPWRQRSNALYTEIKYSLQHTQEPVLATLKLVCNAMHDPTLMGSIDQRARELVVSNAELVCKVFFCLSWQELPPYFEDNMTSFMSELKRLLVYENASIDDGSDSEPSCIDQLVVVVLEILNLYESKHDEDLRPFLQLFVQDAWQLLTRRSSSTKNDSVVTAGIKFLTTITRSPDYGLFSDPTVLSQVCQQIVIPNIELREDDVELFEDNPVEYIRRDMEGSDADTRRRGAVELVKGLCVHFERPVTEAFSKNVTEMLGPQATWKQKDTALFIVTALGWKTGTAAGGVTETSSLIDVVDFFRSHVLPNLSAFAASPQSLSTPIFAADIVKYVIAFRNQIPKDSYSTLIGHSVKLLQSREPVVRTYAAACIERMLTVKDAVVAPGAVTGNGGGVVANSLQASSNGAGATSGGGQSRVLVSRITSQDIAPMLPTLLPAVVTALQSASRADEYIMRLLLRIITVAKKGIAPHIREVVSVAVQVVMSVIDNPANPLFNHYLFEVIAAVIRFCGSASNVNVLEDPLMVPIQSILEKDVTEFGPYVFQILSQLMALHSDALPPTYSALIPPLLGPAIWERRGYVRGMVVYLESYIRMNSVAVVNDGQLQPILGIFNRLVASKAMDHLGIQLLCTILQKYDLAVLEQHMAAIVSVLVLRLQAAKTSKYVQNLIFCLSLLVLRFGVSTLLKASDSLQPGLLAILLEQVWVPEAPSVLRPADRRVCALALADVACSTDICRAAPYEALWPRILTASVALIEGIQTDAGEDKDDDDDDAPIESGEMHISGHNQLRWATTCGGIQRREAEIAHGAEPKVYLADRLASFSARNPGVCGPLISGHVEQGAQFALQKYLADAGKSLS